MPDWLITLLQTITPSILVAVVMGYWNRQQSLKHKAEDDHNLAAKEKEVLELSLLVATAELSYATTMAIKRGSPNGEVEVAVARYEKAMEKFRAFERKQLGYFD